MTMGEPHELIVEYLRRWDIREIKTILRGKQYGASEEEIIRVLVPSGELSLDFLQSLARKPSVDEVIAALKGTMYYEVIKDIDYSESLMKLEDALDKFYYMRMVEIVSRITGSSLYLRVVQMEIDVANLKTMFRLRNAGISGARALEYIIPNGLYLADQDIEKLVSAPFEEFVTHLNKYPYWSAISDVVTDRVESLSKIAVSYTHLRAHETRHDLVCRLLLEKKKK